MNINNLMKKYSIIIVIALFINASCSTVSKSTAGDMDIDDEACLNYPLLLVHGAGFRDKSLGFINYWGRIPKHLEKNNIIIYYGGTDAWGSIEGNAELLKNKITNILEEENTEKVNIIAHSRGGLEARYLISNLGMEDSVASLTTISTPHHGVKAMNLAARTPRGLYKFVSFFVNTWFRILGDKKPDFFTSSRQLSEIYCTQFNMEATDKETVYYQSYASQLKHFFSDIQFVLLNPYINRTDGANDGLCPVESAKWGDYRGIITTEGSFGISHAGVVDSYRVKYKGMDIPELYLNIARNLAAKGF
jgi:triacylglycerol lipase